MPRLPTHKPIDLRKPPTLRKGPARSSKRVLDRYKAVLSLLGTIRSMKAKAAAGFARKFAQELAPGETVPDQTLALELAGRSVERAFQRLEDADYAYSGHGVKRRHQTDACRRMAEMEIYPELRDVRREIEGRFGREKGRWVHRMEGHTRRKPKRQHPQLDRLVRSLKGRKKWPRPLRPGPPGERRDWLRRLEPGCVKLTEMLGKLDRLEVREETLRDDRDFELEWFDVVYGQALDFVRSVFSNAGIGDKVTWHLLPTVQRRRLRGKARQEAEARAEGRRVAGGAGSGAAGPGPSGPRNVA